MRFSSSYIFYWLKAWASEFQGASRMRQKVELGLIKKMEADTALGLAHQDRPGGKLIWLHADDLNAARDLYELLQTIKSADKSVNFMLTLNDKTGIEASNFIQSYKVIVTAIPKDSPNYCAAFINHWQPEALLWASDDFSPLLFSTARKKGVFSIYVNADVAQDRLSKMIWFPNFYGLCLSRFNKVLATSSDAAKYLRRLNAPKSTLEVVGEMKSGGTALPFDEEERTRFAAQIGVRPTWLATHVEAPEIATLAKAQRRVARFAQRLLLILHTEDRETAETAKRRISAMGLKVSMQAEENYPPANADVFIVDGDAKLGLLYRLSPVCFIGGTLTNSGGNDPFEAAALGSAIMHGPSVYAFQESFDRLGDAGAVRLVANSETLAENLSQIISPDKAATMAHSAWEVSTAGAKVTDRVFELLKSSLEIEGRT